MASYAEQSNQGMTNFLGATQGLRNQLAARRSQSTPQFSPQTTPQVNAGRPSMGTKYPSLSGLGSMTTGFGESTRYEKFHPGIDIANKIGTPLNAFASGTVISADTGKKQGDKGYGNRIVIRDDQGQDWSYGHENEVFVKPGQKIQKGQNIGTMGNSGSTYSNTGGTGSHLDLRIFNTFKKKYVNPLQLVS